jgi:hypothetical protein
MIQNEINNLKDKITDTKVVGEMVQGKVKGFRDKLMSLGKGALFTLVIGGVLSLFLPWWIVAVVAAAVAYWVGDSAGRSFSAAFIAISLLWGTYAGIMDWQNVGLLSGRISQLFKGYLTGTQLIYAVGVLGGIVAGLGALTGQALRGVLAK